MSRSLSRLFGQFSLRNNLATCVQMKQPFQNGMNSFYTKELLSVEPVQFLSGVACYSKRNGPPSDAGESFKTVSKSRRGVADDDLNSLEGEPNWELTSKKHNRFYLPNSTGPAWQGDTTTISLLTPLPKLVNFFKDSNDDKTRLEFSCCQCPMLIRETLFELFPVRAVSEKSSNITLLTLSYEGDIELGAAKFVLASRDISDRLLSQGYWADFLNPFSGRPYYFPRDGSKLYKQDHRFRGLNMHVSKHNECVLITAEQNTNACFSGTVFTTAPNDYYTLIRMIVPNKHKGSIKNVVQ